MSMASMQSMPSEIRLYISDYLTSHELLGLAFTCRFYWKTFESVIQKKRQSERYRRIEFDQDEPSVRTVLLEFLRNPLLAQCVEEVSIEDVVSTVFRDEGEDNARVGNHRDSADSLEKQNMLQSTEESELLVESILAHSFINHFFSQEFPGETIGHRNRIIQAVNKPDEGLLYVYFLTLLPNLEELNWPAAPVAWSDAWMLPALRNVVVASSSPQRSCPFRALTHVELTGPDDRGDVNVELLRYVMRIPSLRCLRASMLFGQLQKSSNPIDPQLARSRIVDLDLMVQTATPEAIDQILEGTVSLKDFSLSMEDTYNRSYDSSLVLRSVIAHASQSLEILTFDWCPFWANNVSVVSVLRAS